MALVQDANGNWVEEEQPEMLQLQTGQTPPPPSYLPGTVTSFSDANDGSTLVQPVNEKQFATADTANNLATVTGGTVNNLTLQGPGMEWSSPQANIQYTNGQQVNAGLMQDTFDRYGGKVGSGGYGDYLTNRDITGNTTQDYGAWYNSRPPAGSPPPTSTGPSVTNPTARTLSPQMYAQAKANGTLQPGDVPAPVQKQTTNSLTRPNRRISTTQAQQYDNGTGGGTPTQTTQSSPAGTGGGLKVWDDINGSISGYYDVNGTVKKLNVIPSTGQIYDETGKDVTTDLQNSGFDVNKLRSDFTEAHNSGAISQPPPPGSKPPTTGTSGVGGGGYVPSGSGYAPNTNYAAGSKYQGGTNPYSSFKFSSYPTDPAHINPMYTQQDTPEGENSGEGLQFKSENDRARAMAQGDNLSQYFQNYTNFQQGRASDYEDQANSAYYNIQNGQGGYSDAEKEAILNNPYLQGLQLTDEEAQSNFWNDQEQSDIRGDPWAAYRQLGADEQGMDSDFNLRSDKVRGSLDNQDQYVRGAYQGNAADLRGAVNNQFDDERATLKGYAGNVRDSLDYGEQLGFNYINHNALGLSDEYKNDYNVSARDQQNIQDTAGRSVGAQEAMDEQNLLMNANAQGNTSPLAMQAARDRMRQTGAVNEANAMSDAAIKAKQLQLTTSQNRENTRLGAEQNYAGLGTNAGLTLGARRTGAEDTLGQKALGVASELGAASRGAEQYLGAQRLQSEQYLGGERTSNEQQLGEAQRNSDVFKTGTNLAAGQAADNTASSRATQLATNRQATNMSNQNTRFNRGQFIYNAGSTANKGFADERLKEEAENRGYLVHQGDQANQNVNIGGQQSTGQFGATTGAVNTSTGNAITNSKTPGMAERLAKLGIEAVNAFKPKIPGVNAKGGVFPSGPHMGLVGEAGPELIVDLDKIQSHEGGDVSTPDYIDENGEGGRDVAGDNVLTRNLPPEKKKPNPIFNAIRRGLTNYTNEPMGGSSVNTVRDANVPDAGEDSGTFSSTFAEGGVIAPGIEYVNGPQLKMLGSKSAQAVVPLNNKKGNKVTPSMLPHLAKKYGHYGRHAHG